MYALLSDLAQSPLASFIAQAPFAYALTSVVHILGVAMLFGMILLVDCHLLINPTRAHPAWMDRAIVGGVVGFVLAAASGVLLFISDPMTMVLNRAFQFKLGLLGLAGATMAAYHAIHHSKRLLSGFRRVCAALSILLWGAIITSGRLIAYL